VDRVLRAAAEQLPAPTRRIAGYHRLVDRPGELVQNFTCVQDGPPDTVGDCDEMRNGSISEFCLS
jgi:hypothetical protein